NTDVVPRETAGLEIANDLVDRARILKQTNCRSCHIGLHQFSLQDCIRQLARAMSAALPRFGMSPPLLVLPSSGGGTNSLRAAVAELHRSGRKSVCRHRCTVWLPVKLLYLSIDRIAYSLTEILCR